MNKELVLNFDNNIIQLSIIRSRRKSITLSFNHSGNLLVKSPLYITNKSILEFLHNHKNWILKKYAFIKNNSKHYILKVGYQIPFLGNELTIFFKENIKSIYYSDNSIFLPNNETKTKELLTNWYIKEARSKIESYCNHYTELLGVKHNKISMKSQKTRWGSCSSKNNLNFNWRIILLSEEILKYLVIHEVCHLKFMNHSKDYWDLVELLDNKYKHHREELHKKGYLLTTFLI